MLRARRSSSSPRALSCAWASSALSTSSISSPSSIRLESTSPSQEPNSASAASGCESVDLVARVGARYDVVLGWFSPLEVEHQPELLERLVLGLGLAPLLALLRDGRLGRPLLRLGLAALLLRHGPGP
jgi:hypothetical protein